MAEGKTRAMKDGSPTVYSPESFTWSMPLYDKDQVLTHQMAEIGFSVQDLLEDKETISEQLGSSLVEKRKLSIQDLDFMVPGISGVSSGIVGIEQAKTTYLHTFSIDIVFPVDEMSLAEVYFKWGVDNPAHQQTNVILRNFNGEGLMVACRAGMSEGFSSWDMQFIRNVLDNALFYKGIYRG
jgi:hypothetical protein